MQSITKTYADVYWHNYGMKSGYHDISSVNRDMSNVNLHNFTAFERGYKKGHMLRVLGLTIKEMTMELEGREHDEKGFEF